MSAGNSRHLFSTDGGLTFPPLACRSTANDGSQAVIIPGVSTVSARVRISANNNIFFDISDANILIDPPPQPPIAINDTASTGYQSPVFIPVLANDTDPEGDALSISAVQSPTNLGGTAVVSNNGTPGNTTDDDSLTRVVSPVSINSAIPLATVVKRQVPRNVTVAPLCPPTDRQLLANFEAGNNGSP